MRHYQRLKDIHINLSWVTIGIFDGVHLGHQAIIKEMVAQSQNAGISTGVVTFYPHPEEVLRDNKQPNYITTPDQRAELLDQLGVDFVLTLKFSRHLANMSANGFLSSLNQHLGIKGLWVGNDFALGRNRKGNIEKLRLIGDQLGFFVKESPKFMVGEHTVSSSLIRQFIKEGNITGANQLLGRFFSLEGKVIPGKRRGKSLGIPTANIQPWEKQILPPNGVYATIVTHNRKRYKSVTNLGVKPTFDDTLERPIAEAYIYNFNEEIYGQTVTIELVKHLREERQFTSPEELVDQIHRDIRQAGEVLTHVE